MKNSKRSVVLDESSATRKALVAFDAGTMSCCNWHTLSLQKHFLDASATGRREFMAPLGVIISITLGLDIAWLSLRPRSVQWCGEHMTILKRYGAFCLLVICIALSGCTGGRGDRSYGIAIRGDPHRGEELIVAFGCGACHIIPGIRSAQGLVGPPLTLFAERTMIAGEIPNQPDNLVRWIENPPAIEPKTAMPDLGLSQAQAVDIAAYLYTLR